MKFNTYKTQRSDKGLLPLNREAKWENKRTHEVEQKKEVSG